MSGSMGYDAGKNSGTSGIVGNVSRAWKAGTDIDYASGQYDGPRNFYTPYSSAVNGRVTLDPTIRTMQDAAYNNYGDLRNRYMGNQSAFRQAMLDPLREQYAARRGELQRSIGMRNLGGSSFGDQALTNFDTTSQREIGNAGAAAEQNDLAALSGINEQQNAISQQRLAQELASLGLSGQQIQQYMANFENSQNRMQNQLQLINAGQRTFHNSVTNWGNFGSMAGGGGPPKA